MSSNLIKQWPKLQLVCGIKNVKSRKIILSEFSRDKDFCSAVRELVKNTVNKNIKLSVNDKTKLRKQRKILLGILAKRTAHKRKRRLINQTGSGFLPIVIPLVAQLIGELINKK
jgi:adenine-specific DNA methylase